VTLRSHTLTILGRPLTVRSEAAPEHMERVARLVEKQIKAAQEAGAGVQQRAMVAALNLASELLEEEGVGERLKRDLLQRLDEIDTIVDRALADAGGRR
jgi:cell division protein ZapA (FtsZ GTPase activity inhibitor)